MLGAIVGDIVGSIYEFDNHRSKDFKFFSERGFVTDDSIMTIAIGKAIIETEKKCNINENQEKYLRLLSNNSIKWMQKIGRKYPFCGFGGRFNEWMFSDDPKPYNSYGNGAAMRISPVGQLDKTEKELILISRAVTEVTHNHPEGIKGAEATVIAMHMAQNGASLADIRERMEKDYYKLDFTLDEIRETYVFNERSQDTVPQALVAFLESNSFEDSIRNAISIGGDSDTLAAITGAIAESYYKVPEVIGIEAETYLDNYLRSYYMEWKDFLKLAK